MPRLTAAQYGQDRDTEWGAFCSDLADAIRTRAPDVAEAIGKDEKAIPNSAPLITFTHGGERTADLLKGGAGAPSRAITDTIYTINVEVWGIDAANARTIQRALFVSLDALAHGRASDFGAFKEQQGTATSGNAGVKLVGYFRVRMITLDTVARPAKPASHGIGVTTVAPDGTGGESVTLVP